MNHLKQALTELLSGLTTKKNEKEIWAKDTWGNPITIEPIDDENYILRIYWKDGRLKWEERYKNNLRCGVCRYWYKNGQLRWEYQCKSGRLHGVSKSWNENGTLEREEYWEKGECIEVSK